MGTSTDGLVWRFHLHCGIKFYDDTDFSADVALFSLNRQHQSQHPSQSWWFLYLFGQTVVLQANQDYWAGRPKIDQLIFRSIPDNSVRSLRLQNGSVRTMEFPNPDDLVIIRSDPNLQMIDLANEVSGQRLSQM